MIKSREENLIKDHKHFSSGYHFISFHNLSSSRCIDHDIVKGKLVLVTLEAKGLIEKH